MTAMALVTAVAMAMVGGGSDTAMAVAVGLLVERPEGGAPPS